MNRMLWRCHNCPWCHLVVLCIVICVAFPSRRAAGETRKPLPDHVPPKRSSQIHDGFGINSDLPREPYLPWNRWWWTRMFDAGFKWIRIGQYENSSDRTSWDWIEQKRGVYASSQELEDHVDSLVQNGVNIQVQLLYGNPMYTAAAGKIPDAITPEPGSFHNADRSLYSVFWPPTSPEQIDAFNRYVKWMVDHFHDRIHYWALWNEQDINYWNPVPNPEDYGKLLKSFVQVVHGAGRGAKVIYGGQADPSRDFTKRALAAGTDGNEYDDFGLIHGMTFHETDFTPRPVFFALQNTNALFSDTKFDPLIEIKAPDMPALRRQAGFPFMAFGFRSRSGKAIVAYWLAAHSFPGNFPPLFGDFSLKNTGITHPVLVDVVSGEIKPIEWKEGTTDTLQRLPLKDSVMAIADESYFDWPVLPEAPSSLNVAVSGNSPKLAWSLHGGEPKGTVVERRIESVSGDGSQWKRIVKLGNTASEYMDSGVVKGHRVAYRVRAYNDAGESAYSNIVHVTVGSQ